MESFLVRPATRRQATLAGITTLLILGVFALAVPRATQALPAVPPFMPMCALTVFTTACIVSFLLSAQFTVTRQPILGALGGAYAFTALAVALQLMTFPGVFTPDGLFGAGPDSALWMWVFWHGGFPFFVILAVVMRNLSGEALIRPRNVGLWTWGLVGGPVAVGVALCGLALYGDLPSALKVAGSSGGYERNATALVIWALNVVAIAVVLLRGRLRAVLDIWISIALLACLIDTSLNLLSAARFSVGWYLARVFSMFAPGVLVCVLVWEVTVLYRRLFAAHVTLLQTSVHDALTAIYNRSYFNAQFGKEFERAKRGNLPLSLIMIDVDHFKRYNDALGHPKGDACLVAVASALAGVVRRPADFVCRYGGEEFAIVLPDTDLHGASEIAAQATQAVMRLRLDAPAPAGYVTVSAGCAALRWERLADELVEAADVALYRAKAAGRNRVHLADG